MKTTIYYFSATGNSLTTAARLAEGLGDCGLVPVAATRGRSKIIDESDAVGFVFPVYYGNMPYPMRELVSRIVLKPDAYVFTVATCRGHAGGAPKRMDQLLRTRGQKLSFFREVSMPGNSFINEPQVDQANLENQDQTISRLLEPIRSREVQDHSTAEVLPLTPVAYPNNFRGITADEQCTGCGTCVQVCPMGNISIAEGRALIGDDCATCLACFHWCPVEAIYMSKQENIARRSKYHHPAVQLQDIIGQKG